jgi:hypothetical protein
MTDEKKTAATATREELSQQMLHRVMRCAAISAFCLSLRQQVRALDKSKKTDGTGRARKSS